MTSIAQKNQSLPEGNFPGSMRYDMFRNVGLFRPDHSFYQAFFNFNPRDAELFPFGRNNPPQNDIHERGIFVIKEARRYSRIINVSVIAKTPEYVGDFPL